MAENTPPGLFPFGEVVKPHGTQGGFIAEVSDPFVSADSVSIVYIRFPEKQWVPYRVVEIRSHSDRRRNLFFVRLEGIDSRSLVNSLRGNRIMTDVEPVPDSRSDSDEPSVIGYQVVRSDSSELGDVVDLIETPGNAVFVVQTATNQVMIPWVSNFIEEVNDEHRQIITKNTADLETLE